MCCKLAARLVAYAHVLRTMPGVAYRKDMLRFLLAADAYSFGLCANSPCGLKHAPALTASLQLATEA